jgi:hypothetical protein
LQRDPWIRVAGVTARGARPESPSVGPFELFRAQTNVFHPKFGAKGHPGELNRDEVTRDLIAWLDGVGPAQINANKRK